MGMNRKTRRALKTKEVSQPAPTRKDQVQQEYFQACARAGECQYRLIQFEAELAEINNKIKELNKEYDELLKAEAPKQPVEEAKNVG